MTTEQLGAKLFNACLKAIQDMGIEEFKQASWFGWKKAKPQTAMPMKKAA
jgi:hypothetical protein